MGKKVLIGALAVVGAVLVALAVYVAYVMLGYYRLEDNLALPVQPPASEIAEALPQLELTDELTPLTVVAANLGFGAYGPDFDFFMDGGTGSVARSAEYVRANILGSAEAIKSLDPDFVLFQEVDVQGTRSHNVDEYALLVDAFPNDASVFAQNYDSPYLAWPPYAPHGANRAGMVTFSDCAIADALRRSLPISDSFSKLLDLDRCYSIVRIPTSADIDLVLFNVHLSAYGADAQIMQAQRDMLYADMQKERDAGNFVIAGGDFNHDMIGVSNEVYGNATDTEASWAKLFDFAGVPEGFTVACKAQLDAGEFRSAATCRDAARPYDGTNDRWVMDAFIYSDNVQCLEQQTLDVDFAYSDHNPVYMRFALPKPAQAAPTASLTPATGSAQAANPAPAAGSAQAVA